MVQEFYSLYPKYANLDLYIIGESYGEKQVAVELIDILYPCTLLS